jgi:hypothetical protein
MQWAVVIIIMMQQVLQQWPGWLAMPSLLTESNLACCCQLHIAKGQDVVQPAHQQ